LTASAIQPVFSTRTRIGKDWEKSVNHHISREEDAVFLDEFKIISSRMRRPKRRLTMFPASLHRFGRQINMPALKRSAGTGR
jgi:hypothetical protein